MESRFTFKDFVFAVLIVIVIGAVLWSSFQFSYQESRLNDVKTQIQTLDETQKQQVAILTDIRNQLRSGVMVGTTRPKAETKNIRRTNPDGSLYVEYPEPPRSPRDPTTRPDYATGDWLVQNLDTEPKVLTPYCQKDYVAQLAQTPVLEALAGINQETGELEPVLAESYEQSADGKTIRFKMRPNTCFSDGSPVTVEDVIFSYNTIMNPGVDCAPLRSYFSNVKSCTKIDDRTVEFKLSEPYFLALEFIGGMAIIPKHVYDFTNPEDFNRKSDVLVGSGAYRMEKWERGQQIVMVRNERYWSERPTFDRLIFKFITNAQAAFQAFQNGQIDRFEPDGEQYAKFAKDPDFKKQFIAHKYLRVNSGYGFIGYNLKRPMFKDKKTRTALTMLIDRQSAINNLLKGMGEMTPGPFSPVSPQANADLKPLPYDPEGAKKLLAEAGWKPGPDGVLVREGVRFEFELTMGANNPVGERIANYVKGQFESAGIRMRVTPWEFAVMQTRIDDRNFDAVSMSWMGGGAEEDPTQIWSSKSIADKGSNFISFDNPESDKLLDEARTTMNRAKRMELWHKWEALIADEQPYTFLWARPDRVFVNGRFKNTEPYKLDLAPYDWYVPAAAQKYH
jgi:peptide/nickel transport system substrate-binding protein